MPASTHGGISEIVQGVKRCELRNPSEEGLPPKPHEYGALNEINDLLQMICTQFYSPTRDFFMRHIGTQFADCTFFYDSRKEGFSRLYSFNSARIDPP
jgi:hypothetical protein